MAGKYDIAADQGATLSRVVTWRQPAVPPAITGSPVNVTGFTARMHVRPAADSAELILDLTTENGRILLGGAAGTVTLFVPADVMSGVVGASYVYDLEVVSPTAFVTRLLEGKFKVKAEVTR